MSFQTGRLFDNLPFTGAPNVGEMRNKEFSDITVLMIHEVVQINSE